MLSAFWLGQGDVHYDVDVSRDLLVMDDIVKNHKLTLLGPRSGAIQGIFHGPLWFYINLPVFFVSGGNPLAMGWFWFFLSLIFLLIIFRVAQNLFDFKTAILSVLLFSVNSIVNPSIGLKNFYNPYGAVFLFPVFFFFFYRYTSTIKIKYLIISLFLCGLIIQFQMAFGVPLLLTVTFYLIYLLLKRKKPIHFLSYLILILPLSSFILFDFKHDFLQFKAAAQFLFQEKVQFDLLNIFNIRMNELIFEFFDFLSPGKNVLTAGFGILFLVLLGKSLLKNNYHRCIYFLFTYLFAGFWLISVFYQGGTGNYFWPFLPLAIIIFSSFIKILNIRFFLIAFTLLYLINLYTGVAAILNFKTDVDKRGPHSWAFNKKVAKKIYEDAKEDFGYFSYTPDRFAYQQRYAMIYAKREFPGIKSFSSVKKPLTYLLEVDPPKDRPELSSINWRISDIGIDRLPDKTFRFDFIQVEKYFLTNKELEKTPNPDLLDNVFLR